MDFKMKCRIGFGFEKPKSVHLWLLPEVGPGLDYRSRLRQDSAFFVRTRIRTGC